MTNTMRQFDIIADTRDAGDSKDTTDAASARDTLPSKTTDAAVTGKAASRRKGHRRKITARKIILIVALLLILLGLSLAYWRSNAEIARLKASLSETSATSADRTSADHQYNDSNEAKQLIAKVAKHMNLPDEKPTIATVEDKTKLQAQSFFKATENGDKVLMYTQSKKAILYRPSADRIIEVAYLNIKQ